MEEKRDNIINVTFTYDAPDDYLSQERTLGKTGTWTYEGPDKIYVFVDKADNKYMGRWLSDKNDGADVPTPLDQYKVVVDCTTNPLLCTLVGADQVRDYNLLDQFEEVLPDGKTYSRPNTPPPDHTYELSDLVYNSQTGTFNEPYPWKKPHADWELMRLWRNNQLTATDHQGAAPDMPAAVKTAWEEYRQALRDMPQTHGASNVHVSIDLTASAPTNTVGQRVLKLSSVTGINVGDDVGVKGWPVENIFEDHTHVVEIDLSAKTVVLDKDLVKTPTESNSELAFSPCPETAAWKVQFPDHPFEQPRSPAVPAEQKERV